MTFLLTGLSYSFLVINSDFLIVLIFSSSFCYSYCYSVFVCVWVVHLTVFLQDGAFRLLGVLEDSGTGG